MQAAKQLISKRFVLSLVCTSLFALVCMFGMVQSNAWAADAENIGVYTASVTASYENPDTGTIEDSGGQSSKALGQSMVQGIVQPNAFVEKDGSGQAIITVRFYEASELGEVKVSYDTAHNGSFSAPVVVTLVKEDGAANMNDYQFTVPSEDATLRFTIHVNPMGRDVTFFVKLSDLVEGNTAGFTQTINVDELKANAASKAQASKASGASNTSGTAQVSGGSDIGMIIVIAVVAVVIIGVIAVIATRSRRNR